MLGGTGLATIEVPVDIVATCTASPDTAWVQRPWSVNGSVYSVSVRI